MKCNHDIIEKDNACADGMCPICLAAEIKRTKTWRPTEPAREAAYRRLHDRIVGQDSCITWLLVELRALQKRVNQLEAWRARTVTPDAAIDEARARLDQSADRHTE